MEPSPFHRDLPFLFLNFPCYMNLHPDFTNSFSVFMVKEQELMIMFYIDYYRWLMMVAYHHFFVADLPFFWGFLHRPSPLAPSHSAPHHHHPALRKLQRPLFWWFLRTRLGLAAGTKGQLYHSIHTLW